MSAERPYSGQRSAYIRYTGRNVLPGRSGAVQAMTNTVRIIIVTCGLLLFGDAWALRCGNRLIQEGMTETRVIQLCGEPFSTRYLGYVLRPYVVKRPSGLNGLHSTRRVFAGFHQELAVTEMLFNFGPRKLMRLMRFEGGLLTYMETAGYGHRPKD